MSTGVWAGGGSSRPERAKPKKPSRSQAERNFVAAAKRAGNKKSDLLKAIRQGADVESCVREIVRSHTELLPQLTVGCNLVVHNPVVGNYQLRQGWLGRISARDKVYTVTCRNASPFMVCMRANADYGDQDFPPRTTKTRKLKGRGPLVLFCPDSSTASSNCQVVIELLQEQVSEEEVNKVYRNLQTITLFSQLLTSLSQAHVHLVGVVQRHAEIMDLADLLPDMRTLKESLTALGSRARGPLAADIQQLLVDITAFAGDADPGERQRLLQEIEGRFVGVKRLFEHQAQRVCRVVDNLYRQAALILDADSALRERLESRFASVLQQVESAMQAMDLERD